MVALPVRRGPAVDADPGRREAIARAETSSREDEHGKLGARCPGVGDADFPGVPVRAADGDVAVGVDECARMPVEQRQCAIGDPALGHPVEIERGPALAVEDRAPVPGTPSPPADAAWARAGD